MSNHRVFIASPQETIEGTADMTQRGSACRAFAPEDANWAAQRKRSDDRAIIGTRPELNPIHLQNFFIELSKCDQLMEILRDNSVPIKVTDEFGRSFAIIDYEYFQLLLAATYLASNPDEIRKLYLEKESGFPSGRYESLEEVFS